MFKGRLMRNAGNICSSGFILAAIMFMAVNVSYGADSSKSAKSSAAPRETKMDADEWKKIVEAAKKEGKVIVSGNPSEDWRKSLVDMFQRDYPEITVEYTGINSRDFWPRVRQERGLGKHLWDVGARGVDLPAYEAKRDGFLDPIRPILVAENADDSKWIGGLNNIFCDKEKRYLPGYIMFIQQTTAVNRDFIKESEIKSSSQLLDPKFKGKIVIQTPTGGASFFALLNLGSMYGENFLRDLLSKQNITVTNDNRQQNEWMVRGRYPLAIGFNLNELAPFIKQGLGKDIVKLEDKLSPVSVQFGAVALMKDAPHPNAAKVYINWLLSQKTQTAMCKNINLNSARIDVPVYVKELAVDPARLDRYFNYSTEENTIGASSRFLPIIKEALKY